MENRPGTFFRDAAAMLTNNVLVFSIAMAAGVIVARGLGPAGKGIYSIALLFPMLLSSLGNLGVNHASVYYLNKDQPHRTEIAGSVLFFSVLAGTLLAAGLMLFSRQLSERFASGAGAALILAGAPLLPLFMLSENIHSFFLADRDLRNISIFNAIRNLPYLVLLTAFYLWSALTVRTVLAAQGVALLATVMFGIRALRKAGTLAKIAMKWDAFGKVLAFGLKQHIGTASQMLNYRVDLLIAAALLKPYEIGIYSVSVTTAELLWYVPNSASQILYAKTALAGKSESDRFTPEIARHVLFITLGAALLLGGTGKFFIAALFGREFLPAADVLYFLLPGAVMLSLSKVLGSDISARGFPHYNSTASVISFACAATLNLLLIPKYGLRGAAAATTISYSANAAAMLYFFNKTSAAGLAEIFTPRRSDAYFYLNRLSSVLRRS
jgi:O-antigen/teichoic acid export membrane protein